MSNSLNSQKLLLLRPGNEAIIIEASKEVNHSLIVLQHMEAEVNLNFPRSLEGDRHGKYLLCQQLRRLQVICECNWSQQSGTKARILPFPN